MNKIPVSIFTDSNDVSEFTKFIMGEDPYYVAAKSDEGDPQDFNVAFTAYILSAWEQTGDLNIPRNFEKSLLNIIENEEDINKAIYIVEGWVSVYSFFFNKRMSEPDGYFKDLFVLDLTKVAQNLKSAIEKQKGSLKQDTRWAGVSWSSENGLWDPIVRSARQIRDQFGGPDFVSDNA